MRLDEDDRVWQRMLAGLLGQDDDGYREFWERVGPHLQRIAESRLPSGIRRRVGAEDIVQSACRTFFRRASQGQLELTDAEKLWRLLCAITLNKLREKVRFHLRQRRSVAREQPPPATDDDTRRHGFDGAATIASPDESAGFAELFQHVIASLDGKEQKYVQLRLEEYSTKEIARSLGCTERTVQRIAKRVQSRLRGLLKESWPHRNS